MALRRIKKEPASKLVRNTGEISPEKDLRSEGCPKAKTEFTVKGCQKKTNKISKNLNTAEPRKIPRQQCAVGCL
jgi:hypothetical protein